MACFRSKFRLELQSGKKGGDGKGGRGRERRGRRYSFPSPAAGWKEKEGDAAATDSPISPFSPFHLI